jgi:hypothetical protein
MPLYTQGRIYRRTGVISSFQDLLDSQFISNFLPNNVIEWLRGVLRIREAQGSNICKATGRRDEFSLVFFLGPSTKMMEYYL